MEANNIHCEACDTCKFDHCAGVKCPKFQRWFAVEWKRVTDELKPYFKKKGSEN